MNETIKGFSIQHEDGLTRVREKVSILPRVLLFGFMTVWLSGWTVGCVVLTVALAANFAWLNLVFAMPFYVGWCFGAAALASAFAPPQCVTLDKLELRTGENSWFPTRPRRIKFKEITGIDITTDDGTHTIVVKSSGADEGLFSSTDKDRLEAIRDFLISSIPTLHGDNEPSDQPGNKQPPIARHRTAKPEETSWEFETGFAGETVLVNPGSFEWKPALSVLGFCLFWNGITGVFIANWIRDILNNNPDWFFAVFLTPFVLIGLGILSCTAIVWIDPFRMVEYRFSNREIAWRYSWFGLGFWRQWSLVAPRLDHER